MQLLKIRETSLRLGNKISKERDERKEKQKKIAQDAKNDTQDKQEVFTF